MKELQVTVKAEVIIVPGQTRVRLVPPIGGGDGYESRIFFEAYDGKARTLVDYCTEYVGVHDWRHRKPGVYIKQDSLEEQCTVVKVLFDDETEPKALKLCHLALLDGFRLSEGPRSPDQWYLDELPEEVAFYPGDTVCLTNDLLQTPREIQFVSFTKDGEVQYDLRHSAEEETSIRRAEQETDRTKPLSFRMASRLNFPAMNNVKTKELMLLKRGRIFVLYNGHPDELEFQSLEEEIGFWSQLDLSVRHGPEDKYGLRRNRLHDSLELLRSGQADVIYHLENVLPVSYDPRRLPPTFERFRVRAQKASIAYWERQKEIDERLYG